MFEKMVLQKIKDFRGQADDLERSLGDNDAEYTRAVAKGMIYAYRSAARQLEEEVNILWEES